jgi:hypothetical protein
MAIVVELRGLHSSPDTPARDAELGSLPSHRQWIQVDFRPRGDGERSEPRVAVASGSQQSGLPSKRFTGRDKGDVTLAVGGLAAIPALFGRACLR